MKPCYFLQRAISKISARFRYSVSFYYNIIVGNWQDVLQQYISPDQLPAMYGGTRYEPDAQCSKYIRPGRDVPEKYYLSNQKESNKEDMEMVVVGKGSCHKVCYCYM